MKTLRVFMTEYVTGEGGGRGRWGAPYYHSVTWSRHLLHQRSGCRQRTL